MDRELLAGSLGEPLMPFSAVLTTEEREALVEVTRFGFPSRSWFDVERVAASYSMVRSLSSTT